MFHCTFYTVFPNDMFNPEICVIVYTCNLLFSFFRETEKQNFQACFSYQKSEWWFIKLNCNGRKKIIWGLWCNVWMHFWVIFTSCLNERLMKDNWTCFPVKKTLPGANGVVFGHLFSRSAWTSFGTVSLELMIFTLPWKTGLL